MGALRGSLTYARFFVTGEVPADLAGATQKRIRAAARDICGAEPTDRAAFGAQYDWCVSSVANRAAASLGAPVVVLTRTDR